MDVERLTRVLNNNPFAAKLLNLVGAGTPIDGTVFIDLLLDMVDSQPTLPPPTAIARCPHCRRLHVLGASQ